MSETVYSQLAEHLDRLPAGYPKTESGVEIKILKKLFTPEEAHIATALTMMPEPVGAISARLGMEEAALSDKLFEMSRKGLIYRSSKGGAHQYMAAQFVIGIWEYHVKDLDEELIRLFNEYSPHLMKQTWMKVPTKQLRVIPIAKSVSAEMQIMPYDAAEAIVRKQSKIVVSPCICRTEHKMVGKGCDKPIEVCLSFGSGAFYYEENGLGRSITQDEAIRILELGQEAGLVLQPGNSQKPTNICLCCGCCCQILKNLKAMDEPARWVHSNFRAHVRQEDCTGCGTCVERCQMDAIRLEDTAEIQPERCIGCGLCVSTCPVDAITLQEKEPEAQWTPPANIVETYVNMAKERGLI